jgi:hypothetical protein
VTAVAAPVVVALAGFALAIVFVILSYWLSAETSRTHVEYLKSRGGEVYEGESELKGNPERLEANNRRNHRRYRQMHCMNNCSLISFAVAVLSLTVAGLMMVL